MFTLESPHRGDSNEYKQYAIINIKKKITPIYSKYNNVSSYGIFSLLKNEFETAVVNEPSVFEPLKFYCICFSTIFVQKGNKFTRTSLLTTGLFFRTIMSFQNMKT